MAHPESLDQALACQLREPRMLGSIRFASATTPTQQPVLLQLCFISEIESIRVAYPPKAFEDGGKVSISYHVPESVAQKILAIEEHFRELAAGYVQNARQIWKSTIRQDDAGRWILRTKMDEEGTQYFDCEGVRLEKGPENFSNLAACPLIHLKGVWIISKTQCGISIATNALAIKRVEPTTQAVSFV